MKYWGYYKHLLYSSRTSGDGEGGEFTEKNESRTPNFPDLNPLD